MATSDFVASLTYILSTLILAETVRTVISLQATRGVLRRGFQELIASLELCAVCFELGIVAQAYGKSAYGMSLFAVSVWWSLRWHNIRACPYSHVTDWLNGQTSSLNGLGFCLMDVLGGAMFFQYLQSLHGYFQLGILHLSKMADPKCESDIQTFIWLAALIEGGAVFGCQLLSKYLFAMNSYLLALINSIVSTLLVLAAMSTSGGYFNPMLASALQYGCDGSKFLEHVCVYWVGTIVGAVAADYVSKIPTVQQFFKPDVTRR